MIRRANAGDAARLAEIEVFNYRLNFYPIFRNDEYYFGELQVPEMMKQYEEDAGPVARTWVFDDGAVKGFIRVEGDCVEKLFVEPVLQGRGIGAALLTYAVEKLGARSLWALEKNARAIAFYARHGFCPTGVRRPEDGTEEWLVELAR